jgi:uncharacterized protein (TIGR03435 family)
LTGTYDFTFEYTYEIPGAEARNTQPSGSPDLFHALEDQLGLGGEEAVVPCGGGRLDR